MASALLPAGRVMTLSPWRMVMHGLMMQHLQHAVDVVPITQLIIPFFLLIIIRDLNKHTKTIYCIMP